jgi:hypothetical protein
MLQKAASGGPRLARRSACVARRLRTVGRCGRRLLEQHEPKRSRRPSRVATIATMLSRRSQNHLTIHCRLSVNANAQQIVVTIPITIEPPKAEVRSVTGAPASRPSHHSINGTRTMLQTTPATSIAHESRRVTGEGAPLRRCAANSQHTRSPRSASDIAINVATQAAMPRDACWTSS